MIIMIACIICIISFINTDLGLIILIFSMLLSPEISAGGTSTRNVLIRADDIFLSFILLGWFAKMAVNKELGLIQKTALNLPMGLYVVICLVSSALGMIEGYIKFKDFFFFMLKYIEYYLLFFMVLNSIRTMKQARRYILFMLITCFLVSVISLWQIPTGARVTAPFESEGGEPNTFAAYLILLMGVILGCILYAENSKKRLALMGLFSITLIPFMMTMSRGGWLSFFPMVVAMIIFNKRYRLWLILLIIVVGIFLPAMMPERVHKRVRDTFAAEKTYEVLGRRIGISESAAARLDMVGIAWNLMQRKPVVGYGVPTMGVVDNQYSRVLIETGLVGFAVFIWFLITIFVVILRIFWQTAGNNFAQGVSIGLLAGFCGILVHSLSAATFILIRVMEPFWFLMAIVVVLPELVIQENVKYDSIDVT
ncbi:MAG: O-antigen ligase family protein [Candidatus Omnitrophica bacterium]|nr:O-antigen ligase family protein [Candidatus Omnitrophota bacterium]